MTPAGDEGLGHLCEGYKHFFTHIDRPMRVMSALLASGRAPADAWRVMTAQDGERRG
jgi:uncharacterized protein